MTRRSSLRVPLDAPRSACVRRPSRWRRRADAAQCLVTSVSSSHVRSPLKTAWRAPGTPYSYGLPTTCGISSKLKIGGGDETCHSSVSARHGFAGAAAPLRPARDHVVEEDDRRGAEHERRDRDEHVPVARTAARSRRRGAACPAVPSQCIGKNVRLNADERQPEVELAEPLVVHPPGHLREPVVDARRRS